MTDAPKEITTPPEGYEWTGEVKRVDVGDEYAEWYDWVHDGGRWVANKARGGLSGNYPHIRKIKPPTVLVQMPREWVEYRARGTSHTNESTGDQVARACKEALAKEEAEE